MTRGHQDNVLVMILILTTLGAVFAQQDQYSGENTIAFYPLWTGYGALLLINSHECIFSQVSKDYPSQSIF